MSAAVTTKSFRADGSERERAPKHQQVDEREC